MKNKYQEPTRKNNATINKNKINKEEINNYQEGINNYKKEISKYIVSNEIKEKMFTRINKQGTPKFKLAYSIIVIILTCLISVGIVYAKDIKEFIASWDKTKITFYNTEGNKQEVNLILSRP